MKKRIVPVLIVLFMLVGANAHAAILNISELGISFAVPDTKYSNSQDVGIFTLEEGTGDDLIYYYLWEEVETRELSILSSALETKVVGACQYNVQKPFGEARGLDALVGHRYSGGSYPFMYVDIRAFEKPEAYDTPDVFMEKIKTAEAEMAKIYFSHGSVFYSANKVELYSLETGTNAQGERYYDFLMMEEYDGDKWHTAERCMLFEDLMLMITVSEIEIEDDATTLARAKVELEQACDSLMAYSGDIKSHEAEISNGEWLLTTETGDHVLLEIDGRIYQIETLGKQGRGFISEENGGFSFSSDEASIADGFYYITKNDLQLVSDDGTKTLSFLWNCQEDVDSQEE